MKKIIISFLIISGLIFSYISILNAQETTTTTLQTTTTTTTTTLIPTTTITFPVRPNIKGLKVSDLKQSLEIKEVNGWRLGILSQLPTTTLPTKNAITVYITAGTVNEVGDNYLKVKVFDYTFKVDLTSSSPKILKQNWTKIGFDDISVGDVVNVYGYLDINNHDLIYPINIRDLSILSAHFTFKGIIASIDDNNKVFNLKTNNNQEVKVVVNNSTKIVKFVKNNPPVISGYVEGTFDDLKVNEPVIVRGIYNVSLKTLTAENIIIGQDERPFFKVVPSLNIQQQERESLQNQAQDFKNQIQNRIRELQEFLQQLKAKRGQ